MGLFQMGYIERNSWGSIRVSHIGMGYNRVNPQDARLRLYFRIWEWLRLRRTQTTYRRADGSGRRIEYWVGGWRERFRDWD